MDINIRPIKLSDAQALEEIEKESFSVPWTKKHFEDLLTHDYCKYLVLEVDGEIAGMCGMMDICHEGNIDNVVIRDKFRGKGLGTKLLKKLIERGKQDGIVAFTLEVRVSNLVAIHLYEQLGFVSCGIRPGFYEKPVEDAYIMWLR